jgi:membrane protein YqaA with SNARE-associated domain
MEWLAQFGVIGLGIAAFLAATLLPLSSELIFTGLLLSGESLALLLAVASIGNVLGSVVNYALGRYFAEFLQRHPNYVSAQQLSKAEQHFSRYGQWSLLFAWLPIIGDPLTVLAGVLKMRFVLS